ncbi:superoxide dismutase 1 copper chaperone-like [Miscanthus floridulus]|uniref:superoxide dismutase 1 copper chaperone-like n=1 Tax=Miscanthus floridulus TaxID=154761 RepID=UPI0034582061
MAVVELKVGMHCERCIKAIKKAIKTIDDMESYHLETEINKVTVTGNVTPEEVVKALHKIGKTALIHLCDLNSQLTCLPDICYSTRDETLPSPAVADSYWPAIERDEGVVCPVQRSGDGFGVMQDCRSSQQLYRSAGLDLRILQLQSVRSVDEHGIQRLQAVTVLPDLHDVP